VGGGSWSADGYMRQERWTAPRQAPRECLRDRVTARNLASIGLRVTHHLNNGIAGSHL